jgi:nucleoside-diphosphate-sugar epimerase
MKNEKFNVIITGTTGMVGKGVLLECLEDSQIEKVLLINRSPIDIKHFKIDEILVGDYTKLNEHIDKFTNYDACFHCMGVSSVGMSEEQFSKITYDYTKILADILYSINPDIVFNYVSGTGTDSSENGRIMWANVKGKTENYILNKGFKNAYAFRPGVIIPEKKIKSKTQVYNVLYQITKPIYPILKKFNSVTTTTNVGMAMINTLIRDYSLKHLENSDINEIAKK